MNFLKVTFVYSMFAFQLQQEVKEMRQPVKTEQSEGEDVALLIGNHKVKSLKAHLTTLRQYEPEGLLAPPSDYCLKILVSLRILFRGFGMGMLSHADETTPLLTNVLSQEGETPSGLDQTPWGVIGGGCLENATPVAGRWKTQPNTNSHTKTLCFRCFVSNWKQLHVSSVFRFTCRETSSARVSLERFEEVKPWASTDSDSGPLTKWGQQASHGEVQFPRTNSFHRP